jgi:hypothetical protein
MLISRTLAVSAYKTKRIAKAVLVETKLPPSQPLGVPLRETLPDVAGARTWLVFEECESSGLDT